MADLGGIIGSFLGGAGGSVGAIREITWLMACVLNGDWHCWDNGKGHCNMEFSDDVQGLGCFLGFPFLLARMRN